MIESYPDSTLQTTNNLQNSVLKPQTTIRDEDPYLVRSKKCEDQAYSIFKEHEPRLKKIQEDISHLIKACDFVYKFTEKNFDFNKKFFKSMISKERTVLDLMRREERDIRLSKRNKNLSDSAHFGMIMGERDIKRKQNINKLNVLNNLIEGIERKIKRNIEKEKDFKEKIIVLKRLKKELPGLEKKFKGKFKTMNQAFKDVIRTLADNRRLHNSKKHVKNCCLEKMMIFLRRVSKVENYAYDVVDNLHKQYLVGKDRVKFRGNMIREIMADYITYLQECYTTTDKLVKARQCVMDFDIKSLSEAKFSEKWYLNPPKMAKKVFDFETFFEIKAGIKALRLPNEFHFSIFDHFNNSVLLKKTKEKEQGGCIRIFNSIDQVVYIYIVSRASEIPKFEPVFHCKQESVKFSTQKDKVIFKASGMFSMGHFEFDVLLKDSEIQELFDYFVNLNKKAEVKQIPGEVKEG